MDTPRTQTTTEAVSTIALSLVVGLLAGVVSRSRWAVVAAPVVFVAVLDVFTVLYPQLQGIDLRRSATRLEVPVFLFQGAHEAPGRAGPALEWFNQLQAPDKDLTVATTSGHRSMFEQPEAFHNYLTGVVLPRTRALNRTTTP